MKRLGVALLLLFQGMMLCSSEPLRFPETIGPDGSWDQIDKVLQGIQAAKNSIAVRASLEESSNKKQQDLSNQLFAVEHGVFALGEIPGRGEFETKEQYEQRVSDLFAVKRAEARAEIQAKLAASRETSKSYQGAEADERFAEIATNDLANPRSIFLLVTMGRYDIDKEQIPSFAPKREQLTTHSEKRFRFVGETAPLKVQTQLAQRIRAASDAGTLWIECETRIQVPRSEFTEESVPKPVEVLKEEQKITKDDVIAFAANALSVLVYRDVNPYVQPRGPVSPYYQRQIKTLVVEWKGAAKVKGIYEFDEKERKPNRLWP